MKKILSINLIFLLLFLYSCHLNMESSLQDSASTDDGEEEVDWTFGGLETADRWWLEKVGKSIALKNGVLEIPGTDESGHLLTGIGAFSISELSQVEAIVIGDHIEWISDYGICNMPNLKTVYIGKGVKEIREGLFKDCPALKTVIIDEENPDFKVEGNCLLDKGGTKLLRVWGESFEIPSSVTTVTTGSFSRSDFLTEITLPEGITAIEYEAFYACVNLRKVYLPESIQKIGRIAFLACSDVTIHLHRETDISEFEEEWDWLSFEENVKIIFYE